MKTLKEINVSNKTVLVRTGFDVPIQSGKVMDDFRIRRALPTLDYLSSQKAKVIILTHLGRPQGWGDEGLSLLPVAQSLSDLWNRKLVVVPVQTKKLPEYPIPHLYFFPHNIYEHDLGALMEEMKPGEAAILENIRFYEGEEKNDKEFAKKLASLGQIYVNEAFSDCHRMHASITALPKILPHAAGLDLMREIQILSRVKNHPKKPLVIMVGGAKLDDKLWALLHLVRIADRVLLGGSLASLFLKVKGFEIGKSDHFTKEEEKIAKAILRDHKDKVQLPSDAIVSRNLKDQGEHVRVEKIRPGVTIADIGPKTILEYSKLIKEAQTLIWNGPLGKFEYKHFAHGTYALAQLFGGRARGKAFCVAGGGETLEVIRSSGIRDYLDHVCTGGSALLMFLADLELPGLSAIINGK